MVLPIRGGDIPGIQLRTRQRFPIDRGELWRWLTEPRQLEGWLADRVVVDLRSGGELRLERVVPLAGHAPGAADAATVIEVGRTERLVPLEVWVMAFRKVDPLWEASTRLELAVIDSDGGSELDVLQTGFHHLPLSACLTIWEEYRRRWRDALSRLGKAVTGYSSRPPE